MSTTRPVTEPGVSKPSPVLTSVETSRTPLTAGAVVATHRVPSTVTATCSCLTVSGRDTTGRGTGDVRLSHDSGPDGRGGWGVSEDVCVVGVEGPGVRGSRDSVSGRTGVTSTGVYVVEVHRRGPPTDLPYTYSSSPPGHGPE